MIKRSAVFIGSLMISTLVMASESSSDPTSLSWTLSPYHVVQNFAHVEHPAQNHSLFQKNDSKHDPPHKNQKIESSSHSLHDMIRREMKKNAYKTYAWLGFFSAYHSLAIMERTHYLISNTPLFGSGFFVKSTPSEQSYQRYIAPLNLSLDILSLVSMILSPYSVTLSFAHDDDLATQNQQQSWSQLRKAAREQAAPTSLRAHLIRIGFHGSFALLIAYDYGDPHRAIGYFVSGFLGGQIKSYLAPRYAPKILKKALSNTTMRTHYTPGFAHTRNSHYGITLRYHL